MPDAVVPAADAADAVLSLVLESRSRALNAERAACDIRRPLPYDTGQTVSAAARTQDTDTTRQQQRVHNTTDQLQLIQQSEATSGSHTRLHTCNRH